MILSAALAAACAGAAAPDIRLVPAAGRVSVFVGPELFTEYVYAGTPKPALYPVLGPGQTPMTRNFPFVKSVPDEPTDHPHHRSIWFAHGDVNGVDFWAEGAGKGRLETVGSPALSGGTLTSHRRWLAPDGRCVCTDTVAIAFGVTPEGARTIDYRVTLCASDGDVTLGDTKEGTMAIRLHPNLCLENDPKIGLTTAGGHAVNSEGVRDAAVWGKRARWIDYWGSVSNRAVGVAIFDDPANPRHPTWWHARAYGLVAANPFGVHDFEKKPAHEGNFTIRAGERAAWHYRLVFHAGTPQEARLEEQYAAWAKGG